jgi:peptide deformylase
MALRDIVTEPDPILRKKCRDVTQFDAKLIKLLDDLIETMIANDGAGLAAPQVGILRRAAVIRNSSDEIEEFVNPEILESSGEQLCNEGCLSVKDLRGNVPRPMRIKVKAFDRKGNEFIKEYSEFNADVCSHEFDHLDGILFYDKMIEPDEEDDDEYIDEEE